MKLIEREQRIRDAAATGRLRSFHWETRRDIVHAVVIPQLNWRGWMHAVNCYEYGFHVGHGRGNRWYDSTGDPLSDEFVALLATAPFVGLVESSFRFILQTGPLRIPTRISDAAADGRLRVFSHRNREFVVITPGASDMWRYKSYCWRFGEIVGVRSKDRSWAMIAGGPLFDLERHFANARKADLP